MMSQGPRPCLILAGRHPSPALTGDDDLGDLQLVVAMEEGIPGREAICWLGRGAPEVAARSAKVFAEGDIKRRLGDALKWATEEGAAHLVVTVLAPLVWDGGKWWIQVEGLDGCLESHSLQAVLSCVVDPGSHCVVRIIPYRHWAVATTNLLLDPPDERLAWDLSEQLEVACNVVEIDDWRPGRPFPALRSPSADGRPVRDVVAGWRAPSVAARWEGNSVLIVAGPRSAPGIGLWCKELEGALSLLGFTVQVVRDGDPLLVGVHEGLVLLLDAALLQLPPVQTLLNRVETRCLWLLGGDSDGVTAPFVPGGIPLLDGLNQGPSGALGQALLVAAASEKLHGRVNVINDAGLLKWFRPNPPDGVSLAPLISVDGTRPTRDQLERLGKLVYPDAIFQMARMIRNGGVEQFDAHGSPTPQVASLLKFWAGLKVPPPPAELGAKGSLYLSYRFCNSWVNRVHEVLLVHAKVIRTPQNDPRPRPVPSEVAADIRRCAALLQVIDIGDASTAADLRWLRTEADCAKGANKDIFIFVVGDPAVDILIGAHAQEIGVTPGWFPTVDGLIAALQRRLLAWEGGCQFPRQD
jgi:hypothetical protein